MNFPAHITEIALDDIEVLDHYFRAGGLGQVFWAKWKHSIEPVVIKQIELYEQPTMEQLLEKIIHNQHPNILQIYGVTVIDSQKMWIIMPAISGDLRSALMSREFSNNTNYKLALQAATAVSYLHSRAQPILDVNIHAYNILFQAPDKILLIVKPMLLLAVYTVDWSAPETQQENPNWTPKADVYGLGMLFWEILTKSKVDFGYNSFEVAARIRSGERPVIPDTCPPELATIIRRCWHQNPDERPTSAELVDMLRPLYRAETPSEDKFVPKKTTYHIHHDLFIRDEDIVIANLLGQGGEGTVYTATWNGRGGGTKVAVKQVNRTAFLQRPKTIEDIIKEVEIMASLYYPFICKVHGFCKIDDYNVNLVLAYVEGGDLSRYLLRATEPLPLELQLKFALSAAQAVNYLHDCDPPLLHRDIKSHNLLVQGESLLLADFGIATTQPNNTVVGTLNWSAPETLQERPLWTDKADIYSLGMTFYEIVTRKQPLEDEVDFFRLARRVREGERPTDIPDSCPQAFREVIERCWDQSPTKRPTAAELVQRLSVLLDSWQSGRPLHTNWTYVPEALPQLVTLRYFFTNQARILGEGNAYFDSLKSQSAHFKRIAPAAVPSRTEGNVRWFNLKHYLQYLRDVEERPFVNAPGPSKTTIDANKLNALIMKRNETATIDENWDALARCEDNLPEEIENDADETNNNEERVNQDAL